ncbi:predicted protein [Aspergillus terreus NIH2624]|uniref:Fungal N-terminal domain-containing protein n=1 Tax=Aspergillus terreus (strain NIH 2624 / FGSC A1156) TaxID=341663 RepID=Q0CSD8_ASPTN|nr:uncharacterized protein ATEG_03396 [Aspergillus terreus NIH2624]EAU36670.1 predicted protein [Aspergillus terreus NIH2624]
MTDPFSVGAGVVGVLSLGITVCQGLSVYYGPFTQFDRETKALVQKAEGLTSTLQQLETLLNPLQNPLNSPPDEVNLVTQRIKDCQDELEGLSHALTKCRGCDATTVIEKSGWYYARKALYPFKRGTLISLTETVSNLQSNLDTALLVLNLYAPTYLLNNPFSQPSSIQGIIQTAGRPNHPNLFRFQIHRGRHYRYLYNPDSDRTWATTDIPGYPELPESRSIQSTSTTSRNTTVALQSTTSRQPPSSETRPTKACAKVQNSFLYMSTVVTSTLEEEMTLFHGRYTFCNRFLGFFIQFSMHAISGAGGFTIHPFFDVRRVVPDDAPAFKLLYDFLQFPNLETLSLNGHSADCFLRQLQKLFEDGGASPMDTRSDGSTLLHVSYCVQEDKVPMPNANEAISLRYVDGRPSMM